MLKVVSNDQPPMLLPKIREKLFLVIENETVYVTKCESRWPLSIEATQDTQIQSGSNTRKWAADQDKGKLPLFKLRTGNEEEEKTMQVDEEEEKAPDREATITLEDTKIALKRGGPKYAEEHSQR